MNAQVISTLQSIFNIISRYIYICVCVCACTLACVSIMKIAYSITESRMLQFSHASLYRFHSSHLVAYPSLKRLRHVNLHGQIRRVSCARSCVYKQLTFGSALDDVDWRDREGRTAWSEADVIPVFVYEYLCQLGARIIRPPSLSRAHLRDHYYYYHR